MANFCKQRMQPRANTFLPAVRLNRGECKATHVLFWRAARPHLYVYIYIYTFLKFVLPQTSATSSCAKIGCFCYRIVADKFQFLW